MEKPSLAWTVNYSDATNIASEIDAISIMRELKMLSADAESILFFDLINYFLLDCRRTAFGLPDIDEPIDQADKERAADDVTDGNRQEVVNQEII